MASKVCERAGDRLREQIIKDMSVGIRIRHYGGRVHLMPREGIGLALCSMDMEH
jgi:hypothetical protein